VFQKVGLWNVTLPLIEFRVNLCDVQNEDLWWDYVHFSKSLSRISSSRTALLFSQLSRIFQFVPRVFDYMWSFQKKYCSKEQGISSLNSQGLPSVRWSDYGRFYIIATNAKTNLFSSFRKHLFCVKMPFSFNIVDLMRNKHMINSPYPGLVAWEDILGEATHIK
jgi:hypothetical protein